MTYVLMPSLVCLLYALVPRHLDALMPCSLMMSLRITFSIGNTRQPREAEGEGRLTSIRHHRYSYLCLRLQRELD